MPELIVEVIATILSILIYGTEEKPRHPIWRFLLLSYTFVGFMVMAAGFLGFVDEDDIPRVLIFIWALSCVVALLGEFEFGSKKIALVFLSIGAVSIGLAFLKLFEVI
jgi:multisubunit Na+/H+ antiporter MnhB subunit